MRFSKTAQNAQARNRANRRREQAAEARQARSALLPRVNWQRVRFQVAAVLFIAVWAVLWARAFYVQVVMGPRLETRAVRQHTYTELVEARRGNIYDRNGQTLARSVECRSVYANPREVENVDAAAQILAPLLGLRLDTVQNRLTRDRSFVWLARKIDDATALAIHKANIPGIGLSREYERVYPYKHLAGQLLGFVGLDNKGLEGLERSFDSHLSGLAQKNVVQRDGVGRGYYNGGDVDTWGEDLHLTLDVNIQFIAEDVIAEAVEHAKAKWGGVLIADVATGDVLAWAQYPFFNPNTFRQSSPAEYRNRLAADALEPGSTLKPFLLAAALEEKIVKPNDEFFCENGVWKTNKTVIRDDGRAYANLPARKLLTYSSNIGVAKVALQVGTPTYYNYLVRLGFGQRTGIGVGESKGIVRQPHAWSELDLISAAFGQSVSVTGVQMLQAYTTLANQGLFRPLRLVREKDGHEISGAEQRIFSETTADQLMQMLVDVVDGDGTGSRARIPGLRVAGKTGTAQKAAKGKQGGYGEDRMASFAGIVPANQPRYAILVMLDEPSTTTYGGVLAAPVFQKVASRTMAYGGYLPDVTFARADQPTAAQAPRSPGRSGSRARGAEQAPRAGFMPDLQGKSLRRAMESLALIGAMPEVRGNGVVVLRQEPAPGQPLPGDGAPACVLWLSDEPQASTPGNTVASANRVTAPAGGTRP